MQPENIYFKTWLFYYYFRKFDQSHSSTLLTATGLNRFELFKWAYVQLQTFFYQVFVIEEKTANWIFSSLDKVSTTSLSSVFKCFFLALTWVSTVFAYKGKEKARSCEVNIECSGLHCSTSFASLTFISTADCRQLEIYYWSCSSY